MAISKQDMLAALFSDSEIQTLMNALRIARDVCTDDAKQAEGAEIAEAFAQSAAIYSKLADKLDTLF